MEYRRPSNRLIVVAMVCLASSTAFAQGTSFDPSISLGVGYTDEVEYVGNTGEARSDTTVGMGLTLPVHRDLLRGFLRARYDLEARKYEDTDALDNANHWFELLYERASRRDSTFDLKAEFVQTVDQFGPPILPTQVRPDDRDPTLQQSSDLTISERVERQTIRASLNYGWRAGRRWRLSSGVGLSTSKYEEIRGFGGAQTGLDVEGRDGVDVSFGARQSSRRTDFGFIYSYQLAQLDSGGDEDFHRLELVLERDLSRRVRLEVQFGGFQRIPDDRSKKETKITSTIGIGFNDGLIAGPVRIGFGFGVGPSPRGALSGTSLNTSAGVTFSAVRVQPWNWRGYMGFNRREPFDDQLETTDTISAGASVEKRISRNLGFRLGTSWVDQSSDDTALDGSFLQAGTSLVYYPLAGTRIARR